MGSDSFPPRSCKLSAILTPSQPARGIPFQVHICLRQGEAPLPPSLLSSELAIKVWIEDENGSKIEKNFISLPRAGESFFSEKEAYLSAGEASFIVLIGQEASSFASQNFKLCAAMKSTVGISPVKESFKLHRYLLQDETTEADHLPMDTFFNAVGGKKNGITCRLLLVDTWNNNQPVRATIPLEARLTYEGGGPDEPDQSILTILNREQLQIGKSREALLIKYRIEEVSSKHQDKRFVLLVRPAAAAGILLRSSDWDQMMVEGVSPCYFKPVLVRSKLRKGSVAGSSATPDMQHMVDEAPIPEPQLRPRKNLRTSVPVRMESLADHGKTVAAQLQDALQVLKDMEWQPQTALEPAISRCPCCRAWHKEDDPAQIHNAGCALSRSLELYKDCGKDAAATLAQPPPEGRNVRPRLTSSISHLGVPRGMSYPGDVAGFERAHSFVSWLFEPQSTREGEEVAAFVLTNLLADTQGLRFFWPAFTASHSLCGFFEQCLSSEGFPEAHFVNNADPQSLQLSETVSELEETLFAALDSEFAAISVTQRSDFKSLAEMKRSLALSTSSFSLGSTTTSTATVGEC
jgi:hypothetical protein